MASVEFGDFIKRQNEKKDVKPIDWEQKKVSWLSRLSDLYRLVESYLTEFIEDGSVVISREPFNLSEEYIGSYTAEKLTITVGTQSVEMVPIGTLLIGSAGRVDMAGRRGKVRFVLTDKSLDAPQISITVSNGDQKNEKDEYREPDWAWKIATSAPNIRYIGLDREVFRDAMMGVADA